MQPDYPLLGLLARKPASGYDIGKWLRSDGRFLGRRPSMTPIYRALGELLRRGWVTCTLDQRDAAPDAKVYRLTPAGRQALLEWAASPYEPAERPMAPDFTVRLQFAGQLGPTYALEIVRTELAFRQQQRAEESTALASEDADPVPEIDSQWLQFIDATAKDRGWQSTSWFIGWLETTERQLERIVRAENPHSHVGAVTA
ncbi:PadR family transcriptional regulator [Tessaracoccus sp. MC1756]|uniref:PadR family transcriptional regulator n=1 Tax=Tessaracoccus sp. MC1756 TaxID=2760311 RepID=UPI0016046201|nr:PadR family transcriptional regulator [Tessaracoccus sp. MC1756]MBB1509707.1 PadR family transcriptional regulator [Tessaracoccus sp. MC1756]